MNLILSNFIAIVIFTTLLTTITYAANYKHIIDHQHIQVKIKYNK